MTHVDLVSRFALVELVLCCIPGPAVLVTVATALRLGPRAGLWTVCGVVLGNTLYFGLSAAGVAALLFASYAAFTVLKFVGAAYLAYLGVRLLFARKSELASKGASYTPAPGDEGRALGAGFVTQVSNPKAIVFFVAILPQFIDPRGGFVSQTAVLAVVSQAIEVAVLAGYVTLATRARLIPAAGRASLWFERLGGGALLAIAASIAREPVWVR